MKELKDLLENALSKIKVFIPKHIHIDDPKQLAMYNAFHYIDRAIAHIPNAFAPTSVTGKSAEDVLAESFADLIAVIGEVDFIDNKVFTHDEVIAAMQSYAQPCKGVEGTVMYLSSEKEQQIQKMAELGINTTGQFFEQMVNECLVRLQRTAPTPQVDWDKVESELRFYMNKKQVDEVITYLKQHIGGVDIPKNIYWEGFQTDIQNIIEKGIGTDSANQIGEDITNMVRDNYSFQLFTAPASTITPTNTEVGYSDSFKLEYLDYIIEAENGDELMSIEEYHQLTRKNTNK